MSKNSYQNKALASLQNRLQGLLDDGYLVWYSYDNYEAIVRFLKHKNGNRVILFYSIEDGTITQYTNGKKVFSSKVH